MSQEDSVDIREGRPALEVEWRERLPIVLLAIAMVSSTWLILSLNEGFTFINDEWDPLLNRPGWGLDQVFAPFNGHPTMIPIVLYKLVQEVFGMDSARPIQIVHAFLLVVMNGVLFAYLRRKVGDWAALIGTVMILFLGAAFEVLLFSFTINFTGALAAGVGALIALDRDDRKGDLAAAGLLVLGLCFSLVVLPFLAAATVDWFVNPRNRKGRWFVPGIPLAFLAGWWLLWGREAGASSFSVSNLPTAPGTMFEALSAGFTSLFGLATGDGSETEQPNLKWGSVMAIGAIVLAWLRLKRLGTPIRRDFLLVGTAFLAYLVIIALSEDPSRQPTFSRFQLPTAIFILMTASTLLRGVELRTSWLVAAAIVAALSIQGGVSLMKREADSRWTVASRYFQAYSLGLGLAGADASSEQVARIGPWVTIGPAEFNEVTADYGSPGFDRRQIPGLEAAALSWVDLGLIDGTNIELDAEPPSASNCRSTATEGSVVVEPGRYRIENATTREVRVLIARLGSPPGSEIGAILPNAAAGLTLLKGDLGEPWLISLEPDSDGVRVCGS